MKQEKIPKRRMSTSPLPDVLLFSHRICGCGEQTKFAIKNGRLLYRCRWNKCPDVLWSGIDDVYFVDVACKKCNILKTLRLSETSKNPGNLFYTCVKCGSFRWWHRPLKRMGYDEDRVLNKDSDLASSFALDSASASSSSTRDLALVGEVLCTLGTMMKKSTLIACV